MRSEGKRSARSKTTVAAGVIGAAVLVGLCTAGTAAAGTSNPIIIQPNPVSPGGTISVFDGGNCDFSSTGTVTFQGDDGPGIPAIAIGPLQDMIGGTGRVPWEVRSGEYQVSLTCTADDGHRRQGPFNGTLIVRRGASDGMNPHGGARTGDGASIGSSGTGVAEGAALVVVGGTAFFLLRRRRVLRSR